MSKNVLAQAEAPAPSSGWPARPVRIAWGTGLILHRRRSPFGPYEVLELTVALNAMDDLGAVLRRLVGEHPGRRVLLRFADLRQEGEAARGPARQLAEVLSQRIPARFALLRRAVHRVWGALPLSKAEVLGRLLACGFRIEHVEDSWGHAFVEAVAPLRAADDDEGRNHPLLYRARRVGMHGRPFDLYKLRTMHHYSEHLHARVLDEHGATSTGKVANDYRIPDWGKWLRRYFIDELPGIVNLLKGDLKLVGVRPVSATFLDRYPQALRARRAEVKPGLFPACYADGAGAPDQVFASEARYLDAYRRAPLATDLSYLARGLYNIVVRGRRSA